MQLGRRPLRGARLKSERVPLDRRQHDRVRAPRILVRVPSIDKFRAHYLRDLSAGGLFIRTEKILPVGTEVDIELVPPGLDRPLTLHARVARTVDDEPARLAGTLGIGVQFE